MDSKDEPSKSSSLGAIPKVTTSRDSLKEFVKQRRQLKEQGKEESNPFVKDDYANARSYDDRIRLPTGIIYNDEMTKHKCDWDPNYPENPQRYIAIMDRLAELNLISRCKRITTNGVHVSDDILTSLHYPLHVDLLNVHCEQDEEERERISSLFDAIYINKETFQCATLAYHSTAALLKAISKNEISNGLAVIRPPGHHAQGNRYNGYCFFNNVAIGVKYMQALTGMNRILIIDFDVHHGQGTQQMFYNNKNVLYFSIHRYEHGEFWPNLKESNFDYIGEGDGKGFNINVPLNATGLTDSDYMAIILQILMPVAYEFQPELVLFSAGYDACVGCPEGEMNVTPAFYFHLIKLLSGLAAGRLAVILEGGYFLPSLAEGVAMTLRGLLDDRSVPLDPMVPPHEEVKNVINNLKYVLHNYWKCFNIIKLHTEIPSGHAGPLHKVEAIYRGKEGTVPFATRNCYPVQDPEVIKNFTRIVDDLKRRYGKAVPNSVCYAYDEDMLLHKSEHSAVENPQRLSDVLEQFKQLGLEERCTNVYKADIDAIALARKVHDSMYIDRISDKNFTLEGGMGDMYWNKDSIKSIQAAIKALISIVDAVMTQGFSSGVALIRPPGHHAEHNKFLGFCFVNNIAVAAQYLLDNYNLQRIMIIDFDIHHGNGTQNIFYQTNKVFYVSIHKYEDAAYFPYLTEASIEKIGDGEGKGYNMNIAFDKVKLADIDYLYTFFNIVLPVTYSYAPEFILLSAGFDAGVNDLLGNYKVFPEGFAHMVQMLRSVSGGNLLLAMEGGYNITTLKTSIALCTKTLLGDPIPSIRKQEISSSTREVIEKVTAIHKHQWPVLEIDKPLPLPLV